ncbi:MAG: protein kinase, partial [Planctomycetaceae bacterium]|nr:protein kinase [Planctomycetaceae bacterium]
MTQNDSPLTDEETLDILLDDWEDAVERGSHPIPEIICKDHLHLLANFITKTNLIAQIDGNMLDVESSSEPVHNQAFIEAPPCQNLDWKSHINQLNYHAHGGLGIVFRGFDQQLHRNVAIKFVRKRRRNNPLDVQRFRIEAEITSRLDHPGVAPVHGFGYTDNGVPFYAMRMVEGQTLQQRIEAFHSQIKKEPHTGEQSVEFRKLLSSFVSVCNTIEYTHNRGIVNCDIKPGNIMMGKYGETVVLDWGCAKYVGSDGKAKSAGEESLNPQSDTDQNASTGGTPIYMSPEQHSQKEVGPSSDIYCLGATLYRIVTGQSAFPPEFSLPKTRELVIQGNFPKPTSCSPWVSKALEAICLKAMSLRPEDRYQSAAQMARDLERYLADEEVDAYTEPLSRRFARLMRRHRGVSQILMSSVAMIILITSVSAVMMRNLAINESLAKEQANLMQNRSLQSAARSAATAMALKINDAWRVLEIESSAELLHHELADRMEPDQFGPGGDLQDWLTEKSRLHQQATQAASRFICDAKGIQVARYPYYEDPQMKKVYESIGKNFAHRDYFHGNGYDLSQGERSDPTNISDVHLSAVYKSSNTASLKVAFSIPIWSDHTDSTEREF